jgi:amino acid transporter
VATAAVEERHLLKSLRWYDGFVIALANPGFLLSSLGYSVGDLGGWGAALLWGISAIVAVFINTLYAELAAMFPEKSGGLALYAHEAWRKYSTLIGPIATFGYWIGWSVVLAINGISSARSSRGHGSRASRTAALRTTRTSRGTSRPGRSRSDSRSSSRSA